MENNDSNIIQFATRTPNNVDLKPNEVDLFTMKINRVELYWKLKELKHRVKENQIRAFCYVAVDNESIEMKLFANAEEFKADLYSGIRELMLEVLDKIE